MLYRGMILALCTTLLTLVLGTPTPTAEANLPVGSFTTSVPTGLVAVIADKPQTKSLDLQPVKNPYVSGVDLQIHWDTIEPGEGTMDWSKLDALFAAAKAAHKWVQLSIYPGFFTPGWALKGVQKDRFTIPYGPYVGEVRTLPMPWDGVYLRRWLEFLRIVSDRYGKLGAFKMIAADGPTSVSPEFTLPNQPSELRQWQNDGYTPSKYLAAWRQVLRAYTIEFPNQYISLSVGSGLSINDEGKLDPKQHLLTKQSLVQLGVAQIPHRFALELDDVHAGPGAHTPDSQAEDQFVIGYNGRIVTGFQMKTSALYASKGMGAEGNPPLALRKSIDFAMVPNGSGQRVNYLEIYAPDVTSDQMQSDLKYATTLFAR